MVFWFESAGGNWKNQNKEGNPFYEEWKDMCMPVQNLLLCACIYAHYKLLPILVL